MRRARQNVDAILPGGYASAQWSDEEMLDLANEAYEGMLREFRLVNKHWGQHTINTDSSAITREGEVYTPSSELVINTTNGQKILLPPDFAEIVRITCTNNRDIRFFPSSTEMTAWIAEEQSAFNETNTALSQMPAGLTFFYDVIQNRTLQFQPAVSGVYNLEIDYIPMKRPLYYTNQGTITINNGTSTITGTSTTFQSDNIYAEDVSQRAEVIPGSSDPQSSVIDINRDYERITGITNDTSAGLKRVWSANTVTNSPFIIAMAPSFPREYHRWMARLTSSLMLSKVNPDIAEKYFGKFMTQFKEQINPTIRRRQSQQSQVVEGAEEFSEGFR
jgi:hypothetical protein